MILHTHDLQPLTDEILQTGIELGYYEPGNAVHWLFASEQAHLQVDELHEFARAWDEHCWIEQAAVEAFGKNWHDTSDCNAQKGN